MACLRFTLWLSLLFYDLQFFGAENANGQEVSMQNLQNLQSMKEFQMNDNLPLESTIKLIVKRNTDISPSPQIFKFELNDAKEPDEETKKLIQKRTRELHLNVKDDEVVNMTVSKRSKRSTQKFKPQLIPFLITDAKEPDNATKELIRRSRAKEVSLTTTKELIRLSRHKESSEVTQKREPLRQRRGKTSDNKESLKQGRIKSVALTTLNNDHLRQGKVQSVPLLSAKQDSLKENRFSDGTITPQNRQRSIKKSPKKRTRRFAQLTEPRFIKFEIHDVKQPDSETRAEVQILPRPNYGTRITNQKTDAGTSEFDDDYSAQGSKYRYFIQQAPRKSQFVTYPKRYPHNDLVFRVSKMQKYIASGQGLENINTNIEISIPPAAVTTSAILSSYPNQVYGQKICAYENGDCQEGPVSAVPGHQEFNKPAQNLVAENEVLPEQHQQRYYYNIYPQPQPEVNQQFIPLAKHQNINYQTVAQIVHAPLTEQQPPPQEPQVAQNLIDDSKLIEQNPPVKVAYLEPTYGYGNKLYPYTIAKNIPVQPAHDQSAVVPFVADNNNQEDLQSKINRQANQFHLLKNNQEFQELSALIGKSPADQVHGLSYLLAKEMQRQKGSTIQRPQDQTSPILFHPKEDTSITNSQLVQKQNVVDADLENNQVMPFQPLRQLQKNTIAVATGVQHDIQPQATSQVASSDAHDGKAIGLSPNYNGVDSHNYSPQTIYSEAKNDSTMEYASKYAFGYRVRDFDSGNDFAHKQNRDEDGVTRGQYHILMPDGRIQNVIYYADDTGFHADILN